MRALSSVVVVGSLVALLSGVAGAADVTIRSVPYEQPAPIIYFDEFYGESSV